jgi:hypothetical protein
MGLVPVLQDGAETFPALTLFLYHAREGADGQAVVCPLLRGSSPTRGVAPKQHLGGSGLPVATG